VRESEERRGADPARAEAPRRRPSQASSPSARLRVRLALRHPTRWGLAFSPLSPPSPCSCSPSNPPHPNHDHPTGAEPRSANRTEPNAPPSPLLPFAHTRRQGRPSPLPSHALLPSPHLALATANVVRPTDPSIWPKPSRSRAGTHLSSPSPCSASRARTRRRGRARPSPVHAPRLPSPRPVRTRPELRRLLISSSQP
jgi:hypothetical protein